jgi:hypothetical protein
MLRRLEICKTRNKPLHLQAEGMVEWDVKSVEVMDLVEQVYDTHYYSRQHMKTGPGQSVRQTFQTHGV